MADLLWSETEKLTHYTDITKLLPDVSVPSSPSSAPHALYPDNSNIENTNKKESRLRLWNMVVQSTLNKKVISE